MATRTTSNPSQATWRSWWASRSPAVGAPTAETSAELWRLLGLTIPPRDLRPPMLNHFALTPDEERELDVTAQQAMVAALDYCVASARAWKRRGKAVSKANTAATFAGLFDALARRWSPAYQAVLARTGALSVRDLKRETAEAAARELLYRGIALGAIWETTGTVKRKGTAWSMQDGGNPLYYLTRAPKRPAKIHLRDRAVLSEFERRLLADPEYAQPAHTLRLLPADAEVPTGRQPRQEVCAEIPYNVVEIGPRSTEILDTLERTRLLFDPAAFEKDYQSWERKERRLIAAGVRSDSLALRRVSSRLDVYGRVRAQLRDMKRDAYGLIPLRTVFFRALNRRYHAEYLWLEHTSGKFDRYHYDANGTYSHSTSQRGRWFRFPAADDWRMEPVIGRDISASQTQIMAILMGDHELERLAASRSMKKVIAELLWEAYRYSTPSALPLAESFSDAGELEELAKRIWMTLGYGSSPQQVVRENKVLLADDLARSRRRLEDVLDEFPPYRTLMKFQKVCQRAVGRLGSHQVMRFRDPFDRVDFCWNPAQRGQLPVRIVRGAAVDLMLPGENRDLVKERKRPGDIVLGTSQRWNAKTRKAERVTVVFRPAKVRHGRLPVDKGKMRRELPPFLIHMVDAAYSALVVEGLTRRGVPVVALHDAWFVPGREHAVLDDVLREAAVEWFESLDAVYEQLLRYLPAASGARGEVLRWRQAWHERMARPGDRPVFLSKPSRLLAVAPEKSVSEVRIDRQS